jgi:hypothetical protein
MSIVKRVIEEPPIRLLGYFFVKRFARSVRVIDRWAAVDRPNYLAGVLAAADQALREKVKAISVFEFGVAGGSGLVALQSVAEAVERETGVTIKVFGFDTGEGLPPPLSDYRDHPDQWQSGDYKMDVDKLRQRLTARTELRLGNIKDTLPVFVGEDHPPVGFVACDVDLYSSSMDVLKIFSLPGRKTLRRAFMYFDDIDFVFNHRFAGELLAIEDFNGANPTMKIDGWRGLRRGRVFADQMWIDKMFVVHDLEAISNSLVVRPASDGCQLD